MVLLLLFLWFVVDPRGRNLEQSVEIEERGEGRLRQLGMKGKLPNNESCPNFLESQRLGYKVDALWWMGEWLSPLWRWVNAARNNGCEECREVQEDSSI